VKALALVRRAVLLTSDLRARRNRGLLGRDALFVRAVQITTVMTRRLGQAAEHRGVAMSATERATLEVAASQLRQMGGMLGVDAPPDTPEGALVALVAETLDVVDRLLAAAPTLRSGAVAELTPGDGER